MRIPLAMQAGLDQPARTAVAGSPLEIFRLAQAAADSGQALPGTVVSVLPPSVLVRLDNGIFGAQHSCHTFVAGGCEPRAFLPACAAWQAKQKRGDSRKHAGTNTCVLPRGVQASSPGVPCARSALRRSPGWSGSCCSAPASRPRTPTVLRLSQPCKPRR